MEMFWFSKKRSEPKPKSTDEPILLKTFADRFEAEIVKGLLEARDIPSFITAEDIGETRPYLSGVTGGVRLFVRKDQAEKALTWLDTFEKENDNTLDE